MLKTLKRFGILWLIFFAYCGIRYVIHIVWIRDYMNHLHQIDGAGYGALLTELQMEGCFAVFFAVIISVSGVMLCKKDNRKPVPLLVIFFLSNFIPYWAYSAFLSNLR